MAAKAHSLHKAHLIKRPYNAPKGLGVLNQMEGGQKKEKGKCPMLKGFYSVQAFFPILDEIKEEIDKSRKASGRLTNEYSSAKPKEEQLTLCPIYCEA
ncbi:MAG: hypothetical protein NXI09_00180 [Bacteroidetes bacterium]|nr:hypothetical protein [Bacteroidota bacterium]